ncbi:Transmembrane protein TauE like protein [Heracleum sosnowskyi]|uniref:Transmembrane protein TauE like protein n=1 Tax=Heracleum sosnowskyi TaxID=360622 RepID=A0AAD8MG10_9APIA|nr:Transmembrane protein TauE like protein [Heracleum sosnowskyi]
MWQTKTVVHHTSLRENTCVCGLITLCYLVSARYNQSWASIFELKALINDVFTYVPALYLVLVATITAFVGQHVVRRVINILGRASIIIFILASTIFISAISLGGVGIVNMIGKIQRHEYMGFENLCKYGA